MRLDGKERLVSRTMGFTQLYDISRSGKVLLGDQMAWHGIAGRAPGATRERDLSWLDGSIVRDLSADGRTLLFDEQEPAAGSAGGSYLRSLDGSPPIHLGIGLPRLLSPDGKWVLARNGDSLSLLPTGAGNPRPLAKTLLDSNGACSWFPDGKRLLLSGHKPGESADRLYIQDVAGGPPRAVTPPGVGFSSSSYLSSRATRQFNPRWKKSRSSAKSLPPTWSTTSLPMKQKSRPNSARKWRRLRTRLLCRSAS